MKSLNKTSLKIWKVWIKLVKNIKVWIKLVKIYEKFELH